MTTEQRDNNTPADGVYKCTVSHHRFNMVAYSFRYRIWLSLTNLDASSARRWPARALFGIHSGDHLGDPSQTIRANVDRFLSLNGVDLRGGDVLMLSQARGLGYVFDPVTVFWCHDRDGQLVCLIAEVRNTFGDRHCYLLRPDPAGRAWAEKRLYVSPFLTAGGSYTFRINLTEA